MSTDIEMNDKTAKPTAGEYKTNQINWFQACWRSLITHNTLNCMCGTSIVSCVICTCIILWFTMPAVSTVLTYYFAKDGIRTFVDAEDSPSEGEAIWWTFVIYNCFQLLACIVIPACIFAFCVLIYLIGAFCYCIINCVIGCYQTIEEEREKYNNEVTMPGAPIPQ